ncbi:MAG: tRNA (adenosine(37)-N6)-threonylcarbamoyltransferase complex ATPase subunit type 1 TsaE [Nitrospira sp.]|nr:tRNA (adenosine(37)-N6)-threonylcarbamoyltransferase complex ATPase subunit type 1 TsaE [Nitrospira sp.]
MLSSPAQTDALGQALGRILKGGDVLALMGELGSGKTSLIRGIAAGLGIARKAVSSPTFVLAHEYRGRLPLFHLDLYRVREEAEAEERGLFSYFSADGVTAIEWADRLPTLLPPDHLTIHLEYKTGRGRLVRLAATGPRSSALLMQMSQRLAVRSPRSPAVSLLPANRNKASAR